MLLERPTSATGIQRRWLLSVLLCALLPACSPRDYRLRADREVYGILAESVSHPLWWIPPRPVEAPPESRNFDPFDPDCSPMPPDDPAAHQYMHWADGKHGYQHWHARGDALEVESPFWLATLPLDREGRLQLDRERSVELGLTNSREYQSEVENLYLTALVLSLERFEFDLQWFLVNRTFYERRGERLAGRSPPAESNTLNTFSNFGFRRSFTTGGQLLVDFANSFVWEFTGTDTNAAFSSLNVSLMQPLLRGAFKDVRMEGLTQAERNMLYAVRNFARFRKQFYFNAVSGDDGYLALLLRLQAIRNFEANLAALRENLRAHEALSQAGIVEPIQVDQVFQSYQGGRLQLIRAQNDLETALDQFKIRLGLPPQLEIELDDSLLTPFQFNSPEITQLQEEVERFLAEYRELDQAPTLGRLQEGFAVLRTLYEQSLEQFLIVQEELQQWTPETTQSASQDADQREREQAARESLETRLEELLAEVQKFEQALEMETTAAPARTAAETWVSVQGLARRLSSYIGDAFVVQTQIRAYRVQLEPVDWQRDEAIAFALGNRLDLMNRQAEVVDAWRKIRVAADALEADLDVFAEASIATAPDGNNPLRFSSHDSRYRLGLRFDGPLNRLAERNVYRAELIQYERARRRFIGSRDTIVQAIRLDMRELNADRLNFEIARQSLIVAARQVELARIQLLAPGLLADFGTTQNVLDALNRLLEAKNALISIWVTYETDRLRLLLDTEALQLDERGLQLLDPPPDPVDVEDVPWHALEPDGDAVPLNERPASVIVPVRMRVD